MAEFKIRKAKSLQSGSQKIKSSFCWNSNAYILKLNPCLSSGRSFDIAEEFNKPLFPMQKQNVLLK